MTVQLAVSLAEDAQAIRLCWPVMAQLRPHLDEARFLEQVQRQRLAGYRLAAGRIGERVACVAGFVLGEKLAWGRHLYVDDLVTDAGARPLGAGRAMMAWLKRYAVNAGCISLHLDSGIERTEAHRFYARERLASSSLHFSLAFDAVTVAAGAEPDAPATAVEASGSERSAPARRTLRTGGGPLGEATLFPLLDRENAADDEDFDPSHEGGLDPDFR